MGGYNSGRRSSHPAAEDGFALDVRRLLRLRIITAGSRSAGAIQWTVVRTGERKARIGYEADLSQGDAGRIRLDYKLNGEPQDYTVRLATTECHYGGRRWWFICPCSGRRCAKLYLPPGGNIFAARQAYRLSYRSQREGPTDRSHGRLRRLYERLGDEYGHFEQPPPRRPKGMREKTYARLLDQLAQAEARHDVIFVAGVARRFGSMDWQAVGGGGR